MTRYAETTKVPVERSQAELKETLRRYKASRVITLDDPEQGLGVVQCELRGRVLRFTVQVPELETFRKDDYGRIRTPEQMQRAWEQEERRRWRVLILSVKAKFEEVDSEIAPFDEVFLANIVLPNDQTVAEALLPMIDEAAATGRMPRLTDSFSLALPAPRDN